jgi:hypothetical protein
MWLGRFVLGFELKILQEIQVHRAPFASLPAGVWTESEVSVSSTGSLTGVRTDCSDSMFHLQVHSHQPKCFGETEYFVSWSVHACPDGLKIHQLLCANFLMAHMLKACNPKCPDSSLTCPDAATLNLNQLI